MINVPTPKNHVHTDIGPHNFKWRCKENLYAPFDFQWTAAGLIGVPSPLVPRAVDLEPISTREAVPIPRQLTVVNSV